MLLPRVLGRLLPIPTRCAGLVSADFTGRGGTASSSYGEALLSLGGARLKLVHFGGGALGVDLVDGYREAARGEEADRFEGLAGIAGREELRRYVRRRSGQISDFAYLLEPEGEFWGAGLAFHAVGLADPGLLDQTGRDRLLAVLRGAEFIGIRDRIGADFLEGAGIEVERMPCALTALPDTFGDLVEEARRSAAIEALVNRFPDGWISVETSQVAVGDFDRLVAALREVADRSGLGLVFFEADQVPGRASVPLRRWVESFPEWQSGCLATNDLWETVALILCSRLHCGGCLSSRILCMAGGIARVGVPTGSPEVESYCALWEHGDVPVEFSVGEDWAEALSEALAVSLPELEFHAEGLRRRYWESFGRFCAALGIEGRGRGPARLASHASPPAGFRPQHHLEDEWLEAAAGFGGAVESLTARPVREGLTSPAR